MFIYANSKSIEKDIGVVYKEETIHFISEGRWSNYELLMYLLNKTGPAKVFISSYSICEAAIRTFQKGIASGMFTELTCLFDTSIKKNKIDLLFFISNIVKNIYMAPNHSKIILLENKDWNIVVNGSANLNNNIRYEAGVICTEKATYALYKQKIDELIEKAILLNMYE